MSRFKDVVLQAQETFNETMTLPSRTISDLLKIANALTVPSPLDDYENCLDVVTDDKRGAAGNFEHLIIACIRAADNVHRDRLASVFPELCAAMDAPHYYFADRTASLAEPPR